MGQITLADLRVINEEYQSGATDISRDGNEWVIRYDHGEEERYLSGEEACEALRAYGSGSR